MSTMYFQGWGTVHMWDAVVFPGKKNQTKRRVGIERRVDDDDDSVLDWFNGRLSSSSLHSAEQPTNDE